MFDTIHHIAIIGSDYERSKHFYVDLLGFQIIRKITGQSVTIIRLIWHVGSRK